MKSNPFIVIGSIPEEYFCDRVKETENLIRLLTNGNNVVLFSGRRMGKTELIWHCFSKPAIRDNYHTVYVDILQTTSFQELTYLLGKKVFEVTVSRGRKLVVKFLQALKSLQGKFTYNPVTGLPEFSVQLGDIETPDYTIQEIFEFLDSSDSPCIIAIDEFQQITNYPEKNIEALLRTHIQQCRNCNFIFAGSRQYLLSEMFTYASRPFYHSASMMQLEAIPEDVYIAFVKEMFTRYDRKIREEDIKWIYETFQGYTFYMQKIFNTAFSNMTTEECSRDDLARAIDEAVETYVPLYRELLSAIPMRQKEVLVALAKEEPATGITSGLFIKRHGLSSASSVQNSVKKLMDQNIISREENWYSVTDKFLGYWLNKTY